MNPCTDLLSTQSLLRGISKEALCDIVDSNPSLKSFLLGYIAEMYLRAYLEGLLDKGVVDVSKIPDRHSSKGDFEVFFKNKRWTVELKVASAARSRENLIEGGWDLRAVLKRTDREELSDGSTTTGTIRGEFDILAICTYPVTGKWEFVFIHSEFLPSSRSHQGRVSTVIQVNPTTTPCLYSDLTALLLARS